MTSLPRMQQLCETLDRALIDWYSAHHWGTIDFRVVWKGQQQFPWANGPMAAMEAAVKSLEEARMQPGFYWGFEGNSGTPTMLRVRDDGRIVKACSPDGPTYTDAAFTGYQRIPEPGRST